MKPETKQALGRLNRAFYTTHASEFAASRSRPWAGWRRVLELTPPGPVLDLGCGHGRFAAFLIETVRRDGPGRYLGLDASAELLTLARAQTWPPWVRFAQGDLLDSSHDALPRTHDHALVTLFGVLHHVPGADSRKALLQRALLSLRPGGVLAVSFWRFDQSPRFADRCLSLREHAPRYGVNPEDLEAGDQLLGFGRTAGTPRYCHFPTDAEIAALCELPNTCLKARFRPTRGDVLNEYILLERTDQMNA